ncbi:MAG: OsmC family protein [bacterium]|nr:OsmC family protein [bacterium]
MDMEIVFPGGKRVDAVYRGLTIKTDQSKFGGGEGSAPAPFDLFLASIGTCAGIYVLSFCQERAIPTENMKLVQRMERDAEKKMIRKIEIEIQLPPSFPEKYKQAVVKAAHLCAVEKHLEDPPHIEIRTTVLSSD